MTPEMEIREKLNELGRNLWWTWRPDVRSIFRDLDPRLWQEVNHNPTALLRDTPGEVLVRRAEELGLESRVHHAFRRLAEYMGSAPGDGGVHLGPLRVRPVAYFSAEFALHEAVPIYSGGLGVLAGDHVKSASDLGVPLVAVGLYYSRGYFRQWLDREGWQQETYPEVKNPDMPLELLRDDHGEPITVALETAAGALQVALWRVRVGRSDLLLLDTDVEGNSAQDREITSRLYGGDHRTRIRQELVLGVGGVRALRRLGICPGVLHLNEGHTAFALLESCRAQMEDEGVDFPTARDRVSRQAVFTTHTPVEAGHDRFEPELVEEVLGGLRKALGLGPEEFLGLGRVDPADRGEAFCMTVLAMRLSDRANAVSSLHGHVSRRMWRRLYGGGRGLEVPIGHITNGVHVPSWLARPMHLLYERHAGRDWARRSYRPEEWAGLEALDPGELWETHQVLKRRLVRFARERLAEQAARRSDPEASMARLRTVLDPEVLTIGFARRFATYKRATLLLDDVDRLARMVGKVERPVQVVFAGLAHPHDQGGKQYIQRIFQLGRDPRFEGRVVYLEGYDMNIARLLVQGVDVWLNTPVRPHEACGTSGIKALLNGVLNVSVLDGWWAEAYDGRNGFAIGRGGSHADPQVQWRRDAEELYRVLETQVVPEFYHRGPDGVPTEWVQRMKQAIVTLGWRFSSNRMVLDYLRRAYLPAADGISSGLV
ncbi:MAG: alpha-glucan family phosphorylase [Planctomycetes bacterium]|nr:alpha-glucan family phosphorylase [Planctomycetota bacterium]